MLDVSRSVLRHQGVVAVSWLVMLLAGAVVSAKLGSRLSGQFAIPGAASDQANQEIQALYGKGDAGYPEVATVTGQPGLIRARLYRCLDDDAELRFINVAEWQNRDALEAVTATAEFRASTQRVLHDPGPHIIPRPVLYRVALDLHPGDTL
jgi:heme-degrading monooxygenase HmoA